MELESRFFRFVAELTIGPAAVRRPVAARSVSRLEHEMRRALFRRTVRQIKSVQPEEGHE